MVEERATVGVIGGSGLYEMPGLENVQKVSITTPFGEPSDAVVLGTLHGRRVAFLARHGRGHRLLPSELNFQANIYAMKLLGVRYIFSASAVGSLKEEIRPLDFVLPDQFLDRTRLRKSTFFGDGVVAHISFADPVCRRLGDEVEQAARAIQFPIKRGGTYVCMEGPAFSTRAESNLYRRWQMDLIGMTNLQEAKLAREAEICYVTIAMVTDYDCWREDEEAVSVDLLLEHLHKNSENARRLIGETIRLMDVEATCSCHEALRYAIITDPAVVPAATRRKLAPIIGKYLPG
ncbi:MAG TPA: S-methyl-5'-thioadenosine phosphorylase [Acidobacteriota bacterium]|jgi:5'-methylthioadenosine phosphorylase|nr:S-methyl-5'-thioadenosine phosphorylase [Acidobacteriota bacterium]